MTVDELKSQGNKAFSSGDFDAAIDLFSKAIELDSSNHVLFSNRSAAYASKRDYIKALEDAEKTVSINSSWAKGYSRKGAALYGLGRFQEAVEAYEAGLKIEPTNAQMQKGLEDASEQLMAGEAGDMGGLGNIFKGDVWSKIARNPKLAPLLAQPDLVQKIKDCQANPRMINMHMQDQRMLTLIMGLMGIDATATTEDPRSAQPQEEYKAPPPKKEEPKPEPMEVEEELSEEEKEKRQKRAASDKEKDNGNALYKKRKFEEALVAYDKAFELDETNVAVLTNKAAVLFEMGKYEDTIKICEEAVHLGREHRVDYKLIARALARIGNAYTKLDDLTNAIRFYEKSLAEHRTADVLTKLRECEKQKKLAEKEAYRSIPLSDAARERGNELFKASKFADAVSEYTEAIKRNDKDPRNFSNRAACYIKLMALPEAERDCEEAIKLDENFVKAYIRKAAILHAKRDFMKSIDMCQVAKEKDTEGKHTAEIDSQMMKAYMGLNEVQSGANKEETLKNAMNDPEVQKIMGDPVMQAILQQMKEDPRAAQDHMKNPMIAAKIRTLINAGIIQTR
ncbi:Hsp90 cochaperone [Chytridiales sp. JEL 0842]|nr:Hsp90 cochaperone [Chytridiales sp. JEL 0842]